MIKIPYNKGEPIIYEGDPGSSLYIIMQGKVSVYKGRERVR